jgi:hypothetical protein
MKCKHYAFLVPPPHPKEITWFEVVREDSAEDRACIIGKCIKEQ